MCDKAGRTAGSTWRRVVTKLLVLIVVLIAVMFVADSAAFRIAGYNGWWLHGPEPDRRELEAFWVERFGSLPEGDGMVIAPVMRPDPAPLRGPSGYRVENASPAGELETTNGLVGYGFTGGPEVPILGPLPSGILDLIASFRHGYSGYYFTQVVTGAALVSSDGKLWCWVGSWLPLPFRTREFVGTTSDFPPPSSASGWRTSRIDPYLLFHSLLYWLLLFGWIAYIPELRLAFRHCFLSARTRLRQG